MVRSILLISLVSCSWIASAQSIYLNAGLEYRTMSLGPNQFDIDNPYFTILEASELQLMSYNESLGPYAGEHTMLRIGFELRSKRDFGLELMLGTALSGGADNLGRELTVRADQDWYLGGTTWQPFVTEGTVETFNFFQPFWTSSVGLRGYAPLLGQRMFELDGVAGISRETTGVGAPYDAKENNTTMVATGGGSLGSAFVLENVFEEGSEFRDVASFSFYSVSFGARLRYGRHQLTFDYTKNITNPFSANGDETPWISQVSHFNIGYRYEVGASFGKPAQWFKQRFSTSAYERAEELRAEIRRTASGLEKLETTLLVGTRTDLFMRVPFNDSMNYWSESRTEIENGDTINYNVEFGRNYQPGHIWQDISSNPSKGYNKMRVMVSVPFLTTELRHDLNDIFRIGGQLSYGSYNLFPEHGYGADYSHPVEYKVTQEMGSNFYDSVLVDVELLPGRMKLRMFSFSPYFALRGKRSALTEWSFKGGLKLSRISAHFENIRFSEMDTLIDRNFQGSSDLSRIRDFESFEPNDWVIANQWMVQSMLGVDYTWNRWNFSLTYEGRLFGGMDEDSYLAGFSQVGLHIGYKIWYRQR